jgi:hypothetical protein
MVREMERILSDLGMTKMVDSDIGAKHVEESSQETKNTVFYYRKLPEEKIIMVCKLFLTEERHKGNLSDYGFRRDTVMSIVEDLAKHCREITQFLIQDVRLTRCEVDEM